MAFVHGSSTRVLVNEKELSGQVAGWSVSHQRNMSDVTVVGQTAGAAGASFVPGLRSGTLAIRGPWDSDPTTGMHKEIADAIGVDNAFLATCLPDGVAAGKPAIFTLGDPAEWAIDAVVADAVGYTFTAQADESPEMGYVVADLVARTADGNSTVVDRGAAPITPTTRGAVAAIHVTAYSGLTNVVVKVQHSADNVTYADLMTFTTITGVGQEMIRVPLGTTVNRYLRVNTDVTGTGSATYLVAVAPR